MSDVPDCGVTGCPRERGHRGEHYDPPVRSDRLEALRGYPVVSMDEDGGSIGWSPDASGAYVRWSDLARLSDAHEGDDRMPGERS